MAEKDALLRELRTMKKDVIKTQEDCDGLAERIDAFEAKLKTGKEAAKPNGEDTEDDDPTGLGNL